MKINILEIQQQLLSLFPLTYLKNNAMPNTNLIFLQDKLGRLSQMPYPVHSRIHPLQSFKHLESPVFVKREDELSFGVSGSKFRKYRRLIAYLKEKCVCEAVLIGGAFSNNICGLSSLLIENSIEPTLFLKGPRPVQNTGNYLFSQMLVPFSSFHWIESGKWKNVHDLAQNYISTKTGAILIPEGAALFPSLLGAMSLALDIVQNEHQHHLTFDHLLIDVGTGYSAIALLLAFAFMGKKTQCHLLQLAGTPQEFLESLVHLHVQFEKWLEHPCPFPTNYRLLSPSLCPSFGATNQKLFGFITQMARKEGFFLDPIYSSKLFYEAQNLLENSKELHGPCLIIHSGGALSLSGFQTCLEKSIVCPNITY